LKTNRSCSSIRNFQEFLEIVLEFSTLNKKSVFINFIFFHKFSVVLEIFKNYEEFLKF
jgi:hypothetical protein